MADNSRVVPVEVPHPERTAVVSGTVAEPRIGEFLGQAFRAVSQVVAQQGVQIVGPPFARYHRRGDGRFDVEAGFPVSGYIWTVDAVRSSVLPPGTRATVVHEGAYEEMVPDYAELTAWVRDHGGTPHGDAWEVYLTEPDPDDPSAARTQIVQPYHVESAAGRAPANQ